MQDSGCSWNSGPGRVLGDRASYLIANVLNALDETLHRISQIYLGMYTGCKSHHVALWRVGRSTFNSYHLRNTAEQILNPSGRTDEVSAFSGFPFFSYRSSCLLFSKIVHVVIVPLSVS